MKKNIIVLLTIAVTILVTAICCIKNEHGEGYTIRLINNSNKRLEMYTSILYPDSITSFGGQSNLITIEPKSDGVIYSTSHYNAVLMRNKYKILMIFIMVREVLDTYSMDEIIQKRMYLKKYDLTIDWLEENNWNIYYP